MLVYAILPHAERGVIVKAACILCCLLLSGWGQARSTRQEMKANTEPKACNAEVTFCWYGSSTPIRDEVRAWGNRWITRDGKIPPVESIVEIRCIKTLMVCVLASNYVVKKGKRETSIDLYDVTSWDTTKIEARPDGDDPCKEVNLNLNKIDQTATWTFRPRDSARSGFCAQIKDKLLTATYTLAQ
jgi:hypothetical protein